MLHVDTNNEYKYNHHNSTGKAFRRQNGNHHNSTGKAFRHQNGPIMCTMLLDQPTIQASVLQTVRKAVHDWLDERQVDSSLAAKLGFCGTDLLRFSQVNMRISQLCEQLSGLPRKNPRSLRPTHNHFETHSCK